MGNLKCILRKYRLTAVMHVNYFKGWSKTAIINKNALIGRRSLMQICKITLMYVNS